MDNTNYELQLFDAERGEYRPRVAFGELADMRAFGRCMGLPWRALCAEGEPRQLKPKFRKEARVSDYDQDALMLRVLAWYDERLLRGETVTVYTWKRAKYSIYWGEQLKDRMATHVARYGKRVQFLTLDPRAPGAAFGPVEQDTV